MVSVWSTRLICLIMNKVWAAVLTLELCCCALVFFGRGHLYQLLSRCCDKNNLKEKGLILAHCLWAWPSWQGGCRYHGSSKNRSMRQLLDLGRERHAGAQLTFSFFLFIQFRTPTLAVMLPTFRGVFLPQFSLFRGTGVSPTWLQVQSLEVNNHSTFPLSPVRLFVLLL